MVGLGRVELPTSPLSGVRSSQLSYRPVPERATAGSPAALEQIPHSFELQIHSAIGFEDKVERAERRRRP
jgi:hypothetical protein